jgi:hypothetical protein
MGFGGRVSLRQAYGETSSAAVKHPKTSSPGGIPATVSFDTMHVRKNGRTEVGRRVKGRAEKRGLNLNLDKPSNTLKLSVHFLPYAARTVERAYQGDACNKLDASHAQGRDRE